MRHSDRVVHRRGSACGGTIACVVLLAACGLATEDPQVPSTPPQHDLSSPSVTSTPAPSGTGSESTSRPPATSEPGTTQPTSTTTGGTGPTTSTGAPDLEGFLPPGERSVQDPTGQVDLVVSDVRVGAQPGFDRVVFDLAGTGTVGWRVEYTEEPAQDGSGAPVDLAGDYVLAVHIQGTGLPGADETVYDPPQLLVPGTGLTEVTEVLRLTPFEGQLNAYIGVASEQPFRVSRLAGPERLVVDVAHD